MKRKIIGFYQDEASDWVAVLECGHRQHVRHRPPMVERPWVITAQGREQFIGFPLPCKDCAHQEIKD